MPIRRGVMEIVDDGICGAILIHSVSARVKGKLETLDALPDTQYRGVVTVGR